MIRVLKPGLLTTVQDLGRLGYQQYGVAVGGALDQFAARVANLIVGNDDNAALLELAQVGPELQFTHDTVVAWAGGGFEATIGREAVLPNRAVAIKAGEVLHLDAAQSGLRAWLAVAGGIDVPLVMGSRSTYRRAGVGGHYGRPLLAGDELATLAPGERSAYLISSLGSSPRRAAAWTVRPEALGQSAAPGILRVMEGPEWDWFTVEAQATFLAESWETTREADRMGVRLSGPVLQQAQSKEMISSAVNAGVVQVPPSGQPIVLLPSRQSVGGYPRLAAVAGVDLGRCAQLRPGERVRFEKITVAEAQRLWFARERDLARARLGLSRLAA